jgi:uncharacterized protein (TIGR01777 family)
LAPFLRQKGCQILELKRIRSGPNTTPPCWNPSAGQIDLGSATACDAVVHLAGENIAARWTAERKARIRDSRVNGTRLLCEALARLTNPPKVLVSASATGFYGSRGDEWLDEQSAPGAGFLAGVCQAWEAATKPAADAGIRVVNLRLGIVLARDGGALAKMLPVFRTGLGGKIGSGGQHWSWITLNDLLAAIQHVIATPGLSGPVNAVAPAAATNAEFTRILGSVLSRPTLFPVPAFGARLLFGEMADETLLASARVRPSRLLETGFDFQFPRLEAAFRHLLRP